MSVYVDCCGSRRRFTNRRGVLFMLLDAYNLPAVVSCRRDWTPWSRTCRVLTSYLCLACSTPAPCLCTNFPFGDKRNRAVHICTRPRSPGGRPMVACLCGESGRGPYVYWKDVTVVTDARGIDIGIEWEFGRVLGFCKNMKIAIKKDQFVGSMSREVLVFVYISPFSFRQQPRLMRMLFFSR